MTGISENKINPCDSKNKASEHFEKQLISVLVSAHCWFGAWEPQAADGWSWSHAGLQCHPGTFLEENCSLISGEFSALYTQSFPLCFSFSPKRGRWCCHNPAVMQFWLQQQEAQKCCTAPLQQHQGMESHWARTLQRGGGDAQAALTALLPLLLTALVGSRRSNGYKMCRNWMFPFCCPFWYSASAGTKPFPWGCCQCSVNEPIANPSWTSPSGSVPVMLFASGTNKMLHPLEAFSVFSGHLSSIWKFLLSQGNGGV